MLRSIENVYDKFTSIVSEGRGLSKARVDEIGQGRVWAGSDALGLGLVDELGTLRDAIDYTASLVGFESGSFHVAEYPEPMSELKMLMEMLGQKTEPDQFVKARLSEFAKPQVLARMPHEICVK